LVVDDPLKGEQPRSAEERISERMAQAVGEPIEVWCIGQSQAIREQGGIPMGLLGRLLARTFVRRVLDPVGGLPAELALALSAERIYVFPRPLREPRPPVLTLQRQETTVRIGGGLLRKKILLTPTGAERPYQILGVRSRGGALQRVIDALQSPGMG